MSSRTSWLEPFHKPHQDQHIEQQLAHIVPHDGHGRKAFITQNRRRGGKAGEDNAAQHDDAALQTDTGIAFKKALADTAGGLTGKGCQRDWRNGCGNIEPEEPGVDGQNNDRGRAQISRQPSRVTTQRGMLSSRPTSSMSSAIQLRQLHGHGVREPRGANHGGDNALAIEKAP